MSSKHTASKWIEGLTADQTVAEAAHRVLEIRLGLVWELLPAAAHLSEQDTEHVHQLRVASRRAHAALELFKDGLPPRRARKIGKLLKQVRRAAGEARDYDVQYERLQAFETNGAICTTPVAPFVARRRRDAQGPIVAIYEKLQHKDFLERIGKFLQRLGERDVPDCQHSFGEYASARLRRVEKRFFAAEATGRDGYEALHRFRIQTKELRYTLEIVAALWGEAVRREIYPKVEELQERLGEIVDTHVALDLYRRWSRRSHCDGSRCAWRALIAHQRTELTRLLNAFDAYWTEERAESLKTQLRALAQSTPAMTTAVAPLSNHG